MLYKVNELKLDINHNYEDFKKEVKLFLRCKEELIKWETLKILRKSIDARDKSNIKYIYNVSIDVVKQIRESKNVVKYKEIIFNPKVNDENIRKEIKPIIIGFGPAGIFSAYIFVLNGIKPIIIERGKKLEERVTDVEKFFNDVKNLNENSNVCFGEGGAGAFSDGKLNTGNKDKEGIYKFVLETFVKYGAEENILYDNLPHIGTDKLINIIINMRNDIIKMGATIKYNTKFIYNDYKKYAENGMPIILAIGNSARDTFRDLLNNGFDLKVKPFAIGYRVAHKQNKIDEAQYSNKYIGKLKSATYKLTYDVGNGHSVYSFCMCPGGYIINSSNFINHLSINGMSYNDRRGYYANSAIVETIKPEDLGIKEKEVEKILLFLEKIEKKAYNLENGDIPYKILNNMDNIPNYEQHVFKGSAKKCDDLFSVYENIGLNFNINKDIMEALTYFSNNISDFSSCIIAGVETRTSSPIKINRNIDFMCNKKNFYPCGEGLGHGGGILSCAADGVRVAQYIVKNH